MEHAEPLAAWYASPSGREVAHPPKAKEVQPEELEGQLERGVAKENTTPNPSSSPAHNLFSASTTSSVTLTRSYNISNIIEAYVAYELDVASQAAGDTQTDKNPRRHLSRKRYRELHALNCHLENAYPKLKLPSFPHRIQLLNLDVDGQKRKKALSDYLSFVGSHPQLSSDPTLVSVLHDSLPEASVVLRVNVLQAMSIATTKSGIPDAFCRLTMYDTTFKKIGQVSRTLTAHNGRSFEPQWNDQECCFELPDVCAGVTLSLWHHNLIFSDIFLGRLCLERHTLPRNKSVEHWFPLHPMVGVAGVTVTGAIKLRVGLKTDRKEGLEMEQVEESDLSKRLKEQQLEERTANRLKRENLYGTGQLHVRFLYHPPQGHWEGYLQIEVVECRDLPAKSACYVQLHLQRGSEDTITPLHSAKESEPKRGERRDVPEIELGATEARTVVSKSTTAPKFNKKFHFFLYPSASSSPSDVPDCVKLSLWSRVIFGSDKLIGDHTLVLSDWAPGEWHDQWVTICSSLAEKALPTRMGRSMAREGLVPKYPIVLLPGLASSSLKVEEGNPEWVGEWIWLSLAKIGSQKFKTLFSSPTVSKPADLASSDEAAADVQFRNEWVRHVCLQPDGRSDPPGIRVRPVPGKDGCAYLSPGALTNNLSYVMGPLIENLHDFGYTDSDLVAVPYDWRLSPQMLEERDGFFTKLKETIEKTSERCQSPVVIVAHSMGNRVFQYFLHTVVETEGDIGRQWIDKHVHSYVAVGAPFLGSPKVVRSLATGERMGMEALLRQEEGIAFIRSLGSTGMIMPMAQPRFFDRPREFVYLKGENEGEGLTPLTITETLSLSGASKQMENLASYYGSDRVWGLVLEAPPVKRLFAIYGVNLDTEVFYFYQRNKKGDLVFDKDAKGTAEFQGFTVREGIGYETKDTIQSALRNSTGLRGHRSGDGTVPYVSLNYCTEWRDQLELRVEELEGVEHREILNNRLFFRLLIEHVSEPLVRRQRRERETVVLGRIDDEQDEGDAS